MPRVKMLERPLWPLTHLNPRRYHSFVGSYGGHRSPGVEARTYRPCIECTGIKRLEETLLVVGREYHLHAALGQDGSKDLNQCKGQQ